MSVTLAVPPWWCAASGRSVTCMVAPPSSKGDSQESRVSSTKNLRVCPVGFHARRQQKRVRRRAIQRPTGPCSNGQLLFCPSSSTRTADACIATVENDQRETSSVWR